VLLLIASHTDVRLHHLRQTGHLLQRHEAESDSLALRLAGLPPRFPPAGLLPLAPVQLHARTSNSHGELLSVHKISQALPGIPKAAKEGTLDKNAKAAIGKCKQCHDVYRQKNQDGSYSLKLQ
jgi:hypothetical protein